MATIEKLKELLRSIREKKTSDGKTSSENIFQKAAKSGLFGPAPALYLRAKENPQLLKLLDPASLALGSALREQREARQLPATTIRGFSARFLPQVSGAVGVARGLADVAQGRRAPFLSEEIEKSIPGRIGTLVGTGAEFLVPSPIPVGETRASLAAGKRLLPQLGKIALRGAARGAPIGAALSVSRAEKPEDIKGLALRGAFFGGLLGGVSSPALAVQGRTSLMALKEKPTIKVKHPKNTFPSSPAAKTIGVEGGKIKSPIALEPKGPPPGMKERGFSKTVKKTLPKELHDIVTDYYRPYSDVEALKNAKKIFSQMDWDEAKDLVIKGEHNKTNVALGEIMASDAMKRGDFDTFEEIVKALERKGTVGGQASQAFSMWSRLTPEGMLKYGMKAIKQAKEKSGKLDIVFGRFARDLTDKDKTLIKEYMLEAQKATDPQLARKYTKMALEVINEKIPYGINELLDTYRKNNILSNPRSSMRNIWGNFFNAYITTPLTLVAEGKPLEAAKFEYGAIKAIPSALYDAIKALKGDLTDLQKFDIQEIRGKKTPVGISAFLRFMEAQDRFFSRLIKEGALAQGKSVEQAQKLADYYLYRTKIGSLVDEQGVVSNLLDKTLGGLMDNVSRIPVLNWQIPFARTPYNVAKISMQYSPVGLLDVVGAANKRNVIAKASLGSVASLIGWKLAAEGRTTFAAPTDPEASRFFYDTGKRPFSILIGDRWVPVHYFGPFGFALMLPAMVKWYSEEAPTALTSGDVEKLSQVVASAFYFWSQQTPLSGLGAFVDLARGNPNLSVSKNLAFSSSQFIPYIGLLSYAAKVLDPIYRKPQGFGEQILSQLPFLSQTVEKYYETSTGEPAVRSSLTNFLAPYTIGKQKPEFEPFYRERMEELKENKLINKIKKEIEEGKTPTTEEAGLVYGKQAEKEKTPITALVERKQLEAKYNKADNLYELYLKATDEEMRKKIEENITKRLGIDFGEGLYNYVSKQDIDSKTEYVSIMVGDLTGDEKWQSLVALRKKGIASRKPILSDGVIDGLVEKGIITKKEGKVLKKIEWDEKTKQFKTPEEKPKKIRVRSAAKTSFPKIAFPKAKVSLPAEKQSAKIVVKSPTRIKVRKGFPLINLAGKIRQSGRVSISPQ